MSFMTELFCHIQSSYLGSDLLLYPGWFVPKAMARQQFISAENLMPGYFGTERNLSSIITLQSVKSSF